MPSDRRSLAVLTAVVGGIVVLAGALLLGPVVGAVLLLLAIGMAWFTLGRDGALAAVGAAVLVAASYGIGHAATSGANEALAREQLQTREGEQTRRTMRAQLETTRAERDELKKSYAFEQDLRKRFQQRAHRAEDRLKARRRRR